MAGPLTQTGPSFLGDLRNSAQALIDNPVRRLATLLAPDLVTATDLASQVSKRQFPGQDWDNTQRNALRHSMWIGGMDKAMGAGPDNPYMTGVASTAAKGIGYANELTSYLLKYHSGEADNPEYIRDTHHDLNANAIGAQEAAQTSSPEALAAALKALALQAAPVQPPGPLTPSPGYLTRTEQ